LVVALLVHVYLFAMMFAIMLASLLQGLWTERLTIPAALAQLATMAVLIGAVMWACGYLALGPIPMQPYGPWPLDLAAPFFPAPSGIFGNARLPADGNGEDFAWPGSGMVVLLIATLIRAWRAHICQASSLVFC
jgi:ABC-type xylose transport system permease subunit